MKKVLFICSKNSGRSQIAEAYLKQMGDTGYAVQSAGLEPADAVNPLVVEVMKEDGIDLSQKTTQSAFDLFKDGELFTHVITVCDAETEAKCPIFPGITTRYSWPFPDPEEAEGTHAEKLEQVRQIRDQIKAAIKEMVS